VSKLVFYRQKRYDGGIRTGVELNGETVSERFKEGVDERDPTLLWYVDLRCEGDPLPDDPDLAVPWLLDHSTIIRDGFERFAKKLRVGVDTDLYSLISEDFVHVPKDVRLKIACSAINRINAREMGKILTEIAMHWEDHLAELGVPQEL
jgi:hypothetical protein